MLWQGCWHAGFGVEIYHNLRAHAFYLASGGVLQRLQHGEALVAHMVYLGEHHQRLVEECLVQEVDIDVGNHHVHVVPVLSLAGSTLEVFALSQVEEVEIYRVVDVPQSVEVAESQLHWQRAMKGIADVEVHY